MRKSGIHRCLWMHLVHDCSFSNLQICSFHSSTFVSLIKQQFWLVCLAFLYTPPWGLYRKTLQSQFSADEDSLEWDHLGCCQKNHYLAYSLFSEDSSWETPSLCSLFCNWEIPEVKWHMAQTLWMKRRTLPCFTLQQVCFTAWIRHICLPWMPWFYH